VKKISNSLQSHLLISNTVLGVVLSVGIGNAVAQTFPGNKKLQADVTENINQGQKTASIISASELLNPQNSDQKISTSAVDIQTKSNFFNPLSVANNDWFNPENIEFELENEQKNRLAKNDGLEISDHGNFPNLQNFTIADAIHSSEPGKWSAGRPDGHAPITVMGEHTHGQGEFMFSYRYMYMKMEGNRDGTNSISDAEVLNQFMVTPQKMTMQMHKFGAMYAPSDDLTLMAMIPYVFKSMDHLTRTGVNFTTDSEGFGDIKTSALYKIYDDNNQRIHLNFGVSLPTGSINERDNTPAGNNQILPYPMQIGSGTFDLLPGITYMGQTEKNSWGAQGMGTLRLGENGNGYSLGDEFHLTGWVARNWSDWVSTSLKLKGKTWGNINGADSRLNPNMIPTADPNRRGGTQLDIGFGVNLYAPSGSLKGSRLAIEFDLPLYRNLEGPQLETDWQLTVGLQSSF
jgi:hypothetical protein